MQKNVIKHILEKPRNEIKILNTHNRLSEILSGFRDSVKNLQCIKKLLRPAVLHSRSSLYRLIY